MTCGGAAPTVTLTGADAEGAKAASPLYAATMLCAPAPSCAVRQVGGVRSGMKTQPPMTVPLSKKLTLPLLSFASTDAPSVSVVPTGTKGCDDEAVVSVCARPGLKYGEAIKSRSAAEPATPN